MRRLVVFAGCLALASPITDAATTFPWKATFNKASSPTLSEIHEQIYAAHPEQLKSFPVSNLVWSEKDFELRLESGTIFGEPPIQGAIAGGFFEGKGTVSFAPANVAAQAGLKMSL